MRKKKLNTTSNTRRIWIVRALFSHSLVATNIGKFRFKPVFYLYVSMVMCTQHTRTHSRTCTMYVVRCTWHNITRISFCAVKQSCKQEVFILRLAVYSIYMQYAYVLPVISHLVTFAPSTSHPLRIPKKQHQKFIITIITLNFLKNIYFHLIVNLFLQRTCS